MSTQKEYRTSLSIQEKNSSIGDKVKNAGGRIGGKGKAYLLDDQLVFAKARGGLLSNFGGDFLNNLLYGIPRRLGLYKPYAADLEEAQRYDESLFLDWEDVTGVAALAAGNTYYVLVTAETLEPGQRYKFSVQPKSEHSGIVSTGLSDTVKEFAEDVHRRAADAGADVSVFDASDEVMASAKSVDLDVGSA